MTRYDLERRVLAAVLGVIATLIIGIIVSFFLMVVHEVGFTQAVAIAVVWVAATSIIHTELKP